MLRPTIYIPSGHPCLTEARWQLAQASLEAMVAHLKREALRGAAAAGAEAPDATPVVAPEPELIEDESAAELTR